MNERFGRILENFYFIECYDKDGNLKWTDEARNLVVTEGLNDSLDKHFAVGDVCAGQVILGESGLYTDIRPPSGVEWVIHNIYYSAAVEIYRTDGTNEIKIDSDSAAGCRMGTAFHVTNSYYLRLKNVSLGACYFWYDGIVTKST